MIRTVIISRHRTGYCSSRPPHTSLPVLPLLHLQTSLEIKQTKI